MVEDYITDECIVNEFLNNWFTYNELAEYLCIDESRVISVLSNKEIDSDIRNKILKHDEHIKTYYNTVDLEDYDKENENINMVEYMIENGLSLRDAENDDNIKKKKTAIHDYIRKKLPDESIKVYKEAFELLMEHKSFSTDNKKVIAQVLESYDKLLEDKTIEEIALEQGIGRNVVQRNLDTRLEKIDSTKYEIAKDILDKRKKEAIKDYEFKPKK